MDSIPSPQSFIFSDDYICQWDACLKNFDEAQLLYQHLIDEHVGRKAKHNLCLTCRWDSCSAQAFSKRDHITSHIRIHVDLKPHLCDICQKSFKRRQDLKKHERTHLENAGAGEKDAVESSSSLLRPDGHGLAYQPLTPPSYTDHSPTFAASTVSAHSRFHVPMSPASMTDSSESWSNAGLSSPSYSTSSEFYNSPKLQDFEADLMNSQAFGRPVIDISGSYYGAFPPASDFEGIASPMSAKRARDGIDDILSDTLGSFAIEAKKKRLDPSYNEEMMGRLDAISAILDIAPLTHDRLLTSLPDSNWDQFSQFCSLLFEDVSGEVFEPQTFGTLFPDYKQAQTPVAMDTSYDVGGYSNYNPAALGLNFNSSSNVNNTGSGGASQTDSIYSTVIPDDPYVSTSSTPSMTYGSERMSWGVTSPVGMPMPGVVKVAPARSTVQQPTSGFEHQYVTINNLMNSYVKPEIKAEPTDEIFEPKVVVKVERTYADMSTQTKAKANKNASDGGMMMMQRPLEKKQQSKSIYDGMDPESIMLDAPAVPDTPLPVIEVKEFTIEDLERDEEDRTGGELDTQELHDTNFAAPSNMQPVASTRYGGYTERARAKQAAAAAAAATTAQTEALDPVEAMSRQLAQTHLDQLNVKVFTRPPTIKPVTEGDMDRQIKAAKARSMCAQDPVRKQHAEVVLNLLKSIDSLMADHRQKVAVWKEVQARQQQQQQQRASGYAYRSPGAGSSYPTGPNVQHQGQIRTVSSYLPRRAAPSQSSPLHQDHTRPDPDYSHLRSNLVEDRASSLDSPVLYPTSDLHKTTAPFESPEEPFELSEEERRFIEEDIARTAAARGDHVHG